MSGERACGSGGYEGKKKIKRKRGLSVLHGTRGGNSEKKKIPKKLNRARLLLPAARDVRARARGVCVNILTTAGRRAHARWMRRRAHATVSGRRLNAHDNGGRKRFVTPPWQRADVRPPTGVRVDVARAGQWLFRDRLHPDPVARDAGEPVYHHHHHRHYYYSSRPRAMFAARARYFFYFIIRDVARARVHPLRACARITIIFNIIIIRTKTTVSFLQSFPIFFYYYYY